MTELLENWEAICGIVTAVILLLGAIAELTHNRSMSRIVKTVRTIWSVIPIGNRKVKNMGRTDDKSVLQSVKDIFVPGPVEQNERVEDIIKKLKDPDKYFK